VKSNANDQHKINMLILICQKLTSYASLYCLPCLRVPQGRIQQAQDYVARLNPCTWPCNRLVFASLYPVPGRGSKIIIGVCKSPRQVRTIFGSVPTDPSIDPLAIGLAYSPSYVRSHCLVNGLPH